MKCCRGTGLQRCYFSNSGVRVLTFESAEVVANPDNRGIGSLFQSHNANYSGLAATTINVPTDNSDSHLVFDYKFVEPRDRIRSVRITTNFGNILSDCDNIFNPTVQLFDGNDVALTAPFVASAQNGGAFFTTPVPGAPIDGVSYMRVSNLRGGGPGCPGGVGTVGIREIELLGDTLLPAALFYCPDDVDPMHWVDPRNGAVVNPADLTDCR